MEEKLKYQVWCITEDHIKLVAGFTTRWDAEEYTFLHGEYCDYEIVEVWN